MDHSKFIVLNQKQESNIHERLNIAKFYFHQDKVRNQYTVFVVAGVTGSIHGRELGWKLVQKNWMDFHDRYQGGFLLPRVIKCATENIVKEEKAKEVEVGIYRSN